MEKKGGEQDAAILSRTFTASGTADLLGLTAGAALKTALAAQVTPDECWN